MRADNVLDQGPQQVQLDGSLLVPVGVEVDAPLLHQHAAEMLFGVKGPT
jgi:hypothetical protein